MFMEKNVSSGPTWRRYDVKITEDQYEATIKLWNEDIEIMKNVPPGMKVQCFSMRFSLYSGSLELCTTDETKVEVYIFFT